MKKALPKTRLNRFLVEVSEHTPLMKLLMLMILLWLMFSTGMYLVERNFAGTSIITYGDALYWGVAAFSTAGIASAPVSSAGQLVGGLWIVFGSMLFFGTIVATITTYFMRPMQRPDRMIIEAIEYNLEQLDELTVDELDLLKDTVDTLITHVGQLKEKYTEAESPPAQ